MLQDRLAAGRLLHVAQELQVLVLQRQVLVLQLEFDFCADHRNGSLKIIHQCIDSPDELLVPIGDPDGFPVHVFGDLPAAFEGLFVQQRQVGSNDAIVRHGRGQFVPHGFGHATDFHEILRHHGEPVLEFLGCGGLDLLGDDAALRQMTLFILMDLIHGLGEGVKRKQDQVRIVFNGHEGVDGAGHVCEQHVKRR